MDEKQKARRKFRKKRGKRRKWLFTQHDNTEQQRLSNWVNVCLIGLKKLEKQFGEVEYVPASYSGIEKPKSKHKTKTDARGCSIVFDNRTVLEDENGHLYKNPNYGNGAKPKTHNWVGLPDGRKLRRSDEQSPFFVKRINGIDWIFCELAETDILALGLDRHFPKQKFMAGKFDNYWAYAVPRNKLDVRAMRETLTRVSVFSQTENHAAKLAAKLPILKG